LVQRAYKFEPERYKYAFGIGATHERLAEFPPCKDWFAKAVDLADSEDRRDKARTHRDYCQNEVDKAAAVPTNIPIRITFATKLSFARRELDVAALALPEVFPNALEASEDALIHAMWRKLGNNYRGFAAYEHLVIATPGTEAKDMGKRIAEYDGQIRRRFFPGLPRKRLILILDEEPRSLRFVARNLYPGAAIPDAPFFGFYHRPDRLIVATALGGYGTVLHEIMHALVEDDYPDTPLWLEEGMAMLYERSGWSAEKLIPVLNWRMDFITPDQALADDAFAGIGNGAEVAPEQLALIRLLFIFLDSDDRLAALYAAVKQQGPQTTLAQGLEAVGLNRSAWREFAERSFLEYAFEKKDGGGGGLFTPVEIKFVQRALNAVIGAGLEPDGLWGSNTARALRDFQRRFGLEVDGFVGRNTIVALRREYGKRSLE
jgi:peptidoglycan hydrolase-like protein with peptidoglycan-binding domain